jgi:hypothetical protein
MMKPLIVGATLSLAGVVAFALARDTREDPTAEAPVATAPPVEIADVELADPGQIGEEAPAPVVEELPVGWNVDETGFVWEPLSFDTPQIRNNGDGTLTMRKLARIYKDGEMREVGIQATATPDLARIPIQQRTLPKRGQTAQGDAVEDASSATDGR